MIELEIAHKVNDKLDLGVRVIRKQAHPALVQAPMSIMFFQYLVDRKQIQRFQCPPVQVVAFVSDHELPRAVIRVHEVRIHFNGSQTKA